MRGKAAAFPAWTEEVLPLDDAELLDKVKPSTPNGLKLDREKLKAREDAQVKALLDTGGKLAGNDFRAIHRSAKSLFRGQLDGHSRLQDVQ